MTGLEKIIEKIKSDSEQEAERIIEEVRLQAQEISDTVLNETESECAEIIGAGREKAKVIERIANATAEQNSKRQVLAARREIIDSAFDRAFEKLSALSEKEYFNMLYRLAIKYAEAGEGEMLLSAADKARIPDGFVAEINQSLNGKGTIVTAEDTIETGGGFVLRYGGIEINCTFGALIDDRREQLGDRLSRFIFG